MPVQAAPMRARASISKYGQSLTRKEIIFERGLRVRSRSSVVSKSAIGKLRDRRGGFDKHPLIKIVLFEIAGQRCESAGHPLGRLSPSGRPYAWPRSYLVCPPDGSVNFTVS